jgi:hypothetical protein
MSTMSRHCQNRVQRLRDWWGDTPWSSGSRGLAPGILRSLLCPICSNPRRNFVSPPVLGWQPLSVRLCESEPCHTPPVKSRGYHGFGEVPAKIAAFRKRETAWFFASTPSPHTRHSGAGRNLFPMTKQTPAFAGVTVFGGNGWCKRSKAFHVSQALSRTHTIFHTTASWLGVRTGTFPPFYSQPP